jgi:acetyl-CoA synthetase
LEESITSVSDEHRLFVPPSDFSINASVKSLVEYKSLYKKSIEDPIGFWASQANELSWFRKWDNVLRNDNGFYKWFEGGYLNVAYNCLDKHIEEGKGNKVALMWESESGETKMFTFSQLLSEVNKFGNILKANGVGKGDRVCIYLPMIPELLMSLLACARIGAVHNVVFGGFSSDAIRDRVQDSDAKMIITSDGSFRNNVALNLKENVDKAALECPTVEKILVVKRCGNPIVMKKERDVWLHEEHIRLNPSDDCFAEHLHAEDSLFILYTSGTTGKPKGILHTQAGYLTYVRSTFKHIFDIKDNDVYFCTADIGWITGHSYIVYGPLSNAATVVMYEGGPMYPKADRFWRIIEKYKVSIFYTAPTAIRALMKQGDELPKGCNLKSLRLLGSVGEPINPEAWMWYHAVIGNEKCPIVDTWWQTETGGIMITPLPGATTLKPGSATLPFFGIEPEILKEDGSKAGVNEGGYLVIRKPWPGMLRTVWKNPERYKHTYFGMFDGSMYVAGDSARFDEDGYVWIMGRTDDVIKVSGHRLGTAEVESHIVSHPSVAEAAVVPIPDAVKGQALYAFVTLKKGNQKTDEMRKSIVKHVAEHMGHIAKPEKLQFADDLPKTRSGKIMRRILKVIAEGHTDWGNTTTLADPTVVEKLYKERL